MPELITVCEQAAREAGQLLLEMQSRVRAREKGPKDLVTEADLAAQRLIRQRVLAAFPEHDFLGEEDDPLAAAASGAEFRWIVDPLDGTVNYVHQLPSFAVSIAAARGSEVLAGVVFDPLLNECYMATKGGGAWLNGAAVRASDCRELRAALLAASFSANVERGSREISRFVEMIHACQAVRRLGSAALNLCYLAAGRLDGYWAVSVKPWDVAAGVLIACEAGAVLSNLEGGPFDLNYPQFTAAATPPLHAAMLHVLNEVA